MDATLKDWLREFTPQPLLNLYYRMRYRSLPQNISYGWSGNYASWAEVVALSEGYNSPVIFESVKAAVLKVKTGEAAYERDATAFSQLEYSPDLLRAFHEIAERENGLDLVDFGGSLGSLYFQYRPLLAQHAIRWSIVEQPRFVDFGGRSLANSELSFFQSMADCSAQQRPHTLLLSSVLAYLPNPYAFLNSVFDYGFRYVILYRTAFVHGEEDLLTLQRVPPHIYAASYPSWFLSEQKLLKLFSDRYEIHRTFPGDIETQGRVGEFSTYWKNFIFVAS